MTDAVWQILGAIVVGAISAGGTYFLGVRKIKLDTRIATVSAGRALRDDILALVDRYETREKNLIDRLERNEKRNDELQRTIGELRDQIDTLRSENKILTVELERTRADLAEFDKKVYYRRPTESK